MPTILDYLFGVAAWGCFILLCYILFSEWGNPFKVTVSDPARPNNRTHRLLFMATIFGILLALSVYTALLIDGRALLTMFLD